MLPGMSLNATRFSEFVARFVFFGPPRQVFDQFCDQAFSMPPCRWPLIPGFLSHDPEAGVPTWQGISDVGISHVGSRFVVISCWLKKRSGLRNETKMSKEWVWRETARGYIFSCVKVHQIYVHIHSAHLCSAYMIQILIQQSLLILIGLHGSDGAAS